MANCENQARPLRCVAISMIMPVYNSEKYLAEAVESILAQTFSDFELILVDDGSSDSSPEICDAYAKKDPRVVVVHKPNGGICDARNKGLDAAIGEFVGFIDNDDYLEPRALEDNYKLACEYGADWVKFGKTEILIQAGRTVNTAPSKFCQAVYDRDGLMQALMHLRYIGAMTFVWDSLMRRDIIEKNHLRFDTNFKHGNEDIDFCEIFADFCNKLVVNPVCYYRHYSRIGFSTSSKYSDAVIWSHLYLLEKSNARYQKYGIDTVTTDGDYNAVVTRQLVASSCLKLNSAGKTLSLREKTDVLRGIFCHTAMERYRNTGPISAKSYSKKLCVYRKLFLGRHFFTLLLVDKCGHKGLYVLRSMRNWLKPDRNPVLSGKDK